MHITQEKLKEIFVNSGMLDEDSFASAREESFRTGQTLINVLLGNRSVTESYLAELLEPYFGVSTVDLKQIAIPTEVLELIPESYAKLNNIVSFEHDEKKGVLKVAMIDPLDYHIVEFLRVKLNTWVEPYFTTPSSLKYGLKQYKKKIGEEFNKTISDNVQKFLTAGEENDLAKMAEAVPMINILDNIIEHAVALNASDIHFEPFAKEVLVRYRVDGMLQEILSLPKIIEPILVARVKILASLQIDEHRLPQDGRFRFGADESGSIDVRVNVMPVMHGEKVEMRLLKSASQPLGLEEMGVLVQVIKIITEEIKKPHGMVLVTGPTGHGKTTTLYALLHLLNTSKVNITTIEDPIEYEIPRINQTQVNTKAGINFANGLRSLLRQNPDIIMVGEIRDNETAEISIHAALTGHLVLSSLHTNDATSALPRLLDMNAPAFLLSSTVNMVIAQRLVRRICTSCIESYPMSPTIRKMIDSHVSLASSSHSENIPQTLYRGKGCKICGNSGFTGQIGIFEVLKITDSIRNLLLSSTAVGDIRKQAIKEGMITMFEDGMQKVEKGITAIEEIIRVVKE